MRNRDYIRVTSEGFSFHTLELKLVLKNYNIFYKTIKRLEQLSSSKEFYELSDYGEGRFFCGHFAKNGIRIYLTQLDRWNVIKLVVNPRKLIDRKSTYLGIMLCDKRSLDLMEIRFAAIMHEIGLPPNMDNWTLTRMDLCVNFVFDRKKLPRQIVQLISKGPVAKGFHKEKFTYHSVRFPGQEAILKKHCVKFKNTNAALVVYDKCFQMRQENLALPDEMIPRGVLRLELQCGKNWLSKMATTFGCHTTTEKIYFLARNSRICLTHWAQKLLIAGEYCQSTVLKKRIDETKNISKKVKKRMLKFVNILNRSNIDFDGAIKKMGTDLSEKKLRTLLETFEKLGIAPVPLDPKCKLKTVTSIPSVLKQMGEGELDARLYRKNKKKPKLILACQSKDEGMAS